MLVAILRCILTLFRERAPPILLPGLHSQQAGQMAGFFNHETKCERLTSLESEGDVTSNQITVQQNFPSGEVRTATRSFVATLGCCRATFFLGDLAPGLCFFLAFHV